MVISRWIILRMRNALDKSCRENENTCSVFSNFSENRAVYEIMSKNVVETEGHKWRHNMAHTCCMLDKQRYTRARAFTHPRARAHPHARMHARARAHTHTHTEICNIYCFSTATIIHERASILRYAYVVCLLYYCNYYINKQTSSNTEKSETKRNPINAYVSQSAYN